VIVTATGEPKPARPDVTELAGGHLTARAAGSPPSSPSTAFTTAAKGANHAARLRETLEELGPTFAKLGQIRRRPDLIRPTSPPSSPACRTTCRHDRGGGRAGDGGGLKVPWEDVFERIEPQPLAAGRSGGCTVPGSRAASAS
jgi:hypothetical protein